MRPPYNACMLWKRISVVCFVFLAFIARSAPLTRAQSTSGFTAAWRTAPAVVGQANAVLIASTEPLDPATLTVTVVYGDRESVLEPVLEADGRLSAAFTPTAAGAHALRLTGSLNGQALNEQVPLADVQGVTLGIPAIEVGAPEPPLNTTTAGPNWTLIAGGVLAGALLIAAVLVGRIKR